MKYILSLASVLLVLLSYGQSDTGRIYNCTVLKAGVYKNFQEFINNAPSVTTPIDITYLCISKKDSTIIGASYKLKDGSKKIGGIWGFCDGENVFIRYTPSLIGSHYWKLESLGPYPFFSYPEKDIAAMGPPLMALATISMTASQPAQLKLRTITDNGKTRSANMKRVRKWLEQEPDLLNALNTSGPRYTATYAERTQAIREYLLKLNQRLVQKAR